MNAAELEVRAREVAAQLTAEERPMVRHGDGLPLLMAVHFEDLGLLTFSTENGQQGFRWTALGVAVSAAIAEGEDP